MKPMGLQKPPIVEPVHPLESCELDGLEVAPRSTSMDDLSLVEAVNRFGEGVVVRVADAAEGRLDPSFGETLGVLDREILDAAIAMMDEAAAAGGPSVMERLFESVQDEARMRCPAGSSANDPPRVGVDDEGDIDEAGPGRDIRKIGQPQTVRRGSVELSVHMIRRTGGPPCAQRLASDRSPKAHAPHQSRHRAASCGEALGRTLIRLRI